MKRWLFLALLPLLAAATPPGDDSEGLLRQGIAAFEDRQPARAAELFDRAGLLTRQPTLAAFNLATACYRQVREGTLTALGEAEVAYRCCLQPGDPHRARALYGLGNCLLLRATAGASLDRAALRAAIDRFSECLQAAESDEALAHDARYNRSRARLLLLQAPPPADGVSEEPPQGDDAKDDNPNPPQPKKDRKDKGGPGGKEKQPGAATPSGTEQSPESKEGTPGPGKGVSLPPVSDDNEPVPLAKDDAIEHVARAARRIVEEAAAHRRGKARPAAPGVRDW